MLSLRHFQVVNRAKLLGKRVLHDADNAFKLDGEYILEKKLDAGVVKAHLLKVKGKQILRQSKQDHYMESYIQWKEENK